MTIILGQGEIWFLTRGLHQDVLALVIAEIGNRLHRLRILGSATHYLPQLCHMHEIGQARQGLSPGAL